MGLLSEGWKFDALSLFCGAFALIYLLLKRIYSYWERNNFKQCPNVSYLFGHFKSVMSQKESTCDLIEKLYNNTNEPFIGIYTILSPVLLVRDPELVRSILIKDFSHFTDRGVHSNEQQDVLSGHLFALRGQRWKSLRSRLTPAFSTGKLKAMFSTLLDCGSSLEMHLENVINKNELFDVREIAACHTTNIIASVGFGIDVDTIKNPDNEFRVCGRKIFESSFWNAIRVFCNFIAPKLMSIFHIKVVDSSVEKFIRSVVKQNLDYREKNNVTRKDIFQLLIQLRNTGTVQLDDQWETVINGNEHQKLLTENEISAITFGFYSAAFETSSTTLAFCMYELAKNFDVQKRVHDEIDDILAKSNGQITYESISAMEYLEACIDETLRKYPILPILNRICVKDYKIPGTNNVIEKGVNVFIPAIALQNDSKYYGENPDQFDPNRYLEGNTTGKSFVDRPYMPFGEGPRNCIGLRLGKLHTKVGLVMMLRNFRFELDGPLKSQQMQIDPKTFLLSPLHKIQLRTYKR